MTRCSLRGVRAQTALSYLSWFSFIIFGWRAVSAPRLMLRTTGVRITPLSASPRQGKNLLGIALDQGHEIE